MKHFYPNLNNSFNFNNSISSLCLSLLATLLLYPVSDVSAQDVFTLGEGTDTSADLGVSPFATVNKNSRSQYIYYGPELEAAGAMSGYITAFAINITELAVPLTVKPENVTIKMKQTFNAVFGPALEEGMTTVYYGAVENITATGWHTMTLDTPFEWDGASHIVVEICRSNDEVGTSFAVEVETYGLGDYRTVGLFSDSPAVAGCDLTGETEMGGFERRTRPNAQFTLAQICNGLPTGGTTVVGAGPYCDGAPFTLSVSGGDLASNLSYQWQSAPHTSGPWTNIPGAMGATYSGTQTTATYYRRQTFCNSTTDSAFSNGIIVNGPGCYCEAPTDTANPVGITHVSFSSINNFTTSNATYTFFNSMAEVEQTLTYNLSAMVNTAGGTNYTTAWIDWNSNGDFEASEMYNLGSVTGGANVASGAVAVVTVPANAVVGTTQMRVRTQQSPGNDAAEPCENLPNGETEDYSILVNEHLGIGEFAGINSAVLVYGDDSGLNIKMKEGNIANVDVYDISGRLLTSRKEINNATLSLPEFQYSHQVLIVRITSDTGAVISKKVVL